jgi:hypothetical protein
MEVSCFVKLPTTSAGGLGSKKILALAESFG